MKVALPGEVFLIMSVALCQILISLRIKENYCMVQITSFSSAVTENVGLGVSSLHNANLSKANANVGADISANQNANQPNTQ